MTSQTQKTMNKPMLAGSLMPPNVEHTDRNILEHMSKLRFPVAATLKKDGIRAIRLNKSLLSRTFKEIPNKSIRERSLILPGGMDMELWNPALQYDEVESIVMSRKHPDSDKIQFHLLDQFGDGGYLSRVLPMVDHYMRPKMLDGQPVFHQLLDDVVVDLPSMCNNADDLFNFLLFAEENAGEGICFRTFDSPYKQGRSTLKEQYLIKLARFVRQEVTITGVYEQMENGNSTKRNAVGKMDRSSAASNKLGKNTLGGFHVINAAGETFDVGTGVDLTDKRRKELWSKNPVGQVITIKHKPHGKKIKPRSPIFMGFRNQGF
jgi:DNA ligase 1